ncbi:hypothetical protein HUJ04_008971 [Dendroctonus ponderosae]|nr:hypothetical protein HUJ04_008971 [Dendroctonus ponderosae]
MTSSVAIRYTRNLFLRSFCAVYLAVFVSIYYQAPGLYGDHGVLPARAVLENSHYKTLSAKIHYKSTLLWLAPYLGLSTSAAIDVLALLGIFFAFTGLVSQKFCIVPVFTAMWSLFFSIYQVGQEILYEVLGCARDELLLEAGFLAVFIAPFLPHRRKVKTPHLDMISFWLCRFLAFRVLTGSVLKLLSGCPKWWSLMALKSYFETMPLPSPLARMAFDLPYWFLEVSTVYTIVCELAVPFLFFWPGRTAKITAFYAQVLLQLGILATGNFGHANSLMIAIMLSLLDDQFFYGKQKPRTVLNVLDVVLTGVLWIALFFGTVHFFGLRFSTGGVRAEISFTKMQFSTLIENALPLVVLLLIASFLLVVARSTYQVLFGQTNSSRNPVWGFCVTVFYTIVGALILTSSSTSLLSLHPKTNATAISSLQRAAYNRLHKTHIVNDYRWTPQLADYGGRPEIILEGANHVDGPWKEYNLLFKPGNVNQSLPMLGLYLPRLDWQFYWAAQSTADKQPWLLSLTHRLLHGNPDVLHLIDSSDLPFSTPPKYIRGVLYKYKFQTAMFKGAWWVREQVGEYFPAHSKDSPALEDYLRARNLLPAAKPQPLHPAWKRVLDPIRQLSNQFEGSLLVWAVLATAFAIIVSINSR